MGCTGVHMPWNNTTIKVPQDKNGLDIKREALVVRDNGNGDTILGNKGNMLFAIYKLV